MVPTVACSAGRAGADVGANRTTQALIVICAVALQWSVTQTYWGQAWVRERAAIAIDGPGWWISRNASMWGFREAAYDPKDVTRTPPMATETMDDRGRPKRRDAAPADRYPRRTAGRRERDDCGHRSLPVLPRLAAVARRAACHAQAPAGYGVHGG